MGDSTHPPTPCVARTLSKVQLKLVARIWGASNKRPSVLSSAERLTNSRWSPLRMIGSPLFRRWSLPSWIRSPRHLIWSPPSCVRSLWSWISSPRHLIWYLPSWIWSPPSWIWSPLSCIWSPRHLIWFPPSPQSWIFELCGEALSFSKLTYAKADKVAEAGIPIHCFKMALEEVKILQTAKVA